jgi:hypothetical protein
MGAIIVIGGVVKGQVGESFPQRAIEISPKIVEDSM